uniref:Uncharacterized protein n=1 Tax=Anguilla anguilla TaxID=7936 RepID=A0A0E9QP54_ANGAN
MIYMCRPAKMSCSDMTDMLQIFFSMIYT